MHKVVFIPVTLPRRVVLGYFLPTFANHFIFCVPLLLENHSISWHQFFSRYSWYHSEGYLTKNNLKSPYSLSLFAQSHFQVSEGLFCDMFLYFLRAAPSYLMKSFFFTITVNVLRKTSQHISFNWGKGSFAVLLNLFSVYSSMLWET